MEARLPQLKKIVLVRGNRPIYRDTFEKALAELTGGGGAPRAQPRSALQKLQKQAQQLVQEIQAIQKEAAK